MKHDQNTMEENGMEKLDETNVFIMKQQQMMLREANVVLFSFSSFL